MQSKSSKYKVYIENKFGYQLKGIFTLEKVMDILDNHIIEQQKKSKILVIETNKDFDYPFFLYAGDYIEYLTFKADFIFDKPKQKKKEVKYGNK